MKKDAYTFWQLLFEIFSYMDGSVVTGNVKFVTKNDEEALYSQQKQDRELTMAWIMNSFIAKFRLKLKKVGKTTRPFKYDLKQIPYDYIVEVTNKFKGYSDRVPEELCTDVHDTVQETVIRTIPKKKTCRKAKWLSEEALQIAEKRREAEGKGQKKDISIWMQSSKE